MPRLVLAALAAAVATLGSASAAAIDNVVFVLLDDLDLQLGGLTPMKRVRSILQDGGTTFTHATVNTPVCCPSRSELLTGTYNHNMHTNKGGCMWVDNTSEEWARMQIPSVLKQQGINVTTGVFGKLLNNHDAFCGKNLNGDIMRPWDRSMTLCSDSSFFNDTYGIDGTEQRVVPGYQTAVLGNASIDFVRQAAGRGERFFLYLAPHAPHIADGTFDFTCQPAPWYANASLPSMQAPRTPAWDVSSPDKHWLFEQQPPMDEASVAWTDRAFRQRWRALLSVDDVVDALHAELGRLGVLDTTAILFTSDHGYILGSWRQPSGKWQMYDESIRVPFLAAGPGIEAGGSSSMMISNVDWAPTIVDLLGGDSVAAGFDGKSFAHELTGGLVGGKAFDARGGAFREASLIEYWGLGHVLRGAPGTPECGPREGVCAPGCDCHLHLVDTPNNTYLGVRLHNDSLDVSYAAFYPDNLDSKLEQQPYFFELYDVAADPYQLKNLAVNPSPANRALMDELQTYARGQFGCKGASCA